MLANEHNDVANRTHQITNHKIVSIPLSFLTLPNCHQDEIFLQHFNHILLKIELFHGQIEHSHRDMGRACEIKVIKSLLPSTKLIKRFFSNILILY